MGFFWFSTDMIRMSMFTTPSHTIFIFLLIGKEMNNSLIYFSESADHLLSGTGKFEEIIACSQEIAASTAQLVAASNVKNTKRFYFEIEFCFS